MYEEIRANSRTEIDEEYNKILEYTVKELQSMDFKPEEVRHYEVPKFTKV